jgi:hypothetical protein
LIDSDPMFDDRETKGTYFRWSELQWFRALGNATVADALPTERQERALTLDARIDERLTDVDPEALACAARALRNASIGAHRAFVERAHSRVVAYGDAVDDVKWRAAIASERDRLRTRLERLQ